MKKNFLGYAALFFVAAASQAAPQATTLPVAVSPEAWRPLQHHASPTLQMALENRLRATPLRKKLLDQGRFGVGLVDMTDPAKPRFAHVNGDVMMYAASLPKIAVLFAANGALEEGLLQDSPALQRDMAKMIRVSSNSAATAVIDRMGEGTKAYERINNTMRNSRFKFYDPRQGGGLWVGKRFAKRGGRVGDPMKNISHAASATQVCRMYYMLATGKAYNPTRSAAILKHLSKPGLNHYFVGALRRRAPQAELYRKSGSWSKWRSDSVIVWGPERRYILVGMMEAGDPGKKILGDLVPLVEAAMKDKQVASAR